MNANAPFSCVIAEDERIFRDALVKLLVELLENYQCEAVVMGARGAGKPESADLGSVASSVLRHSPVPVTIVHLRPPAEAELPET